MTSTAITVGQVRRALQQRETMRNVASLNALLAPDVEAIEQAVASLSPLARIDLSKLIDAVRAQRAEAQPRAGSIWRYAITLMDDDEVAEFKALVADGVQLNEAASRAMTAQASTAPPARRSIRRIPSRRSIARVPSKRAQQQMQPVDRAERARPIAQEPAPSYRFGPRVFGSSLDGSRPYGCPEGASYDAWRNPSRPPWLLDYGDDGDEDDASNETIVDGVELDECDDDECDDDE